MHREKGKCIFFCFLPPEFNVEKKYLYIIFILTVAVFTQKKCFCLVFFCGLLVCDCKKISVNCFYVAVRKFLYVVFMSL